MLDPTSNSVVCCDGEWNQESLEAFTDVLVQHEAFRHAEGY